MSSASRWRKLFSELRDGKTLAQVAKAHDKSLDDVKSAAESALDEAPRRGGEGRAPDPQPGRPDPQAPTRADRPPRRGRAGRRRPASVRRPGDPRRASAGLRAGSRPRRRRVPMFFLGYIASELRRRRGRTFLTALGLGLGVGLVVTVAALSDGLDKAQDEVLEPLTGVGTDLSVTRPLEIDQDGTRRTGARLDLGNLSDSEREAAPARERARCDRGSATSASPGEKFTRHELHLGPAAVVRRRRARSRVAGTGRRERRRRRTHPERRDRVRHGAGGSAQTAGLRSRRRRRGRARPRTSTSTRAA